MSFFHYVTYKYIIIKDKRLGCAYYLLAFIIILYTITQLLISKSYLQFDLSPSGNMRILVNTPAKIQNAENGYDTIPHYCCKTNDSLKDRCMNCRKLDGMFLNWPVESRAVTIATFIKEKWQKQDCENSAIYDPSKELRFQVLRENDFYTVNPEFALIKIEHSITAFGGMFSETHRKMNGALLGHDGKVLKILNSNDVSKADKILIKDFLKAANVSLDEQSDALNARERSYRQNGVIIHVQIHYKNSDRTWFGVDKLNYVYKVRKVMYSDYRLKKDIPIPNNNGRICERIIHKRYAVRLEFHQGGKIGQFSTGNLVIQLVSVMGLLTLTATIIDVIALYVIPNKENYRQYVFDKSPEFERLKNEKECENANKEELLTDEKKMQ